MELLRYGLFFAFAFLVDLDNMGLVEARTAKTKEISCAVIAYSFSIRSIIN